jgi:hypothetical protein
MPRESIAEGDELVAGGRCGRLGDGDFLGVVTGERLNHGLLTKGLASDPRGTSQLQRSCQVRYTRAIRI